MTFKRWTLRGAVASAAMACVSIAQAGLVTYSASDEGVLDVKNIPGTMSAASRSAFEGTLDGASIRRETFEGFTNGQTAEAGLKLFGSDQVTLTSTPGAISNITGDEFGPTGRFNTTAGCARGKCNWWETTATFTLAFDQSYSAFAFYGTDFSDFGATVWLDLLDSDLSTVTSLLVNGATAATATGINNVNGTGSLLNFGFTDSTRSYGGVRFRIEQPAGALTTPPTVNLDYLGFDELVLGNLATGGGTVPEPATLALVALSLAGLAVSRRKKAQPQR